jgi:hypothetical protein
MSLLLGESSAAGPAGTPEFPRGVPEALAAHAYQSSRNSADCALQSARPLILGERV